MKAFNELEKVLIDEETIAQRIKAMGEEISRDYEGKEILVVCILKGGFIFAADLVRALSIPIKLDFMAVSSYGNATYSSGQVQILKDLTAACLGKHVLIVEDLIDTGLTLQYLKELLSAREPASLKICTFLDKPDRRKTLLEADYVGFTIPDAFVIGYGLDYAEKYRNLPYVGVLKS
jgi:hypoxanthine phosphoribosyltransferase